VTDWPRLLLELRRAGLTVDEIALATHSSRGAVHGWLNLGAEPRYSTGVLLIALHAKHAQQAAGIPAQQ
jgi:hypothetical protein